VNPSFPYLEKG